MAVPNNLTLLCTARQEYPAQLLLRCGLLSVSG